MGEDKFPTLVVSFEEETFPNGYSRMGICVQEKGTYKICKMELGDQAKMLYDILTGKDFKVGKVVDSSGAEVKYE